MAFTQLMKPIDEGVRTNVAEGNNSIFHDLSDSDSRLTSTQNDFEEGTHPSKNSKDTSLQNLKSRIQLHLAKLNAPKLSGSDGSTLEFDDGSENAVQSRLFSIMSKKTKTNANCKGVSALQSWKIDTERRMKEKRDIEMAERQKLYNIEQEQLLGDKDKQSDDEAEMIDNDDDDELTDEETSELSDNDESHSEKKEKTTIRSDKNEIAPTDEYPSDLCSNIIPCPKSNHPTDVDLLSQETQDSLHLYIDTENPEDKEFDNEPRDKGYFATISPNKENCSHVGRTINSDFVGAEKCMNSNLESNCSLDQSQASIAIKPAYAGLGLEDNNMTSQQAFDEAMLLLTNPFYKADELCSTPDLHLKTSQSETSDVAPRTQTQVIFPEDENANDGISLKPEARAGLIMDKQLTSQEAEAEILHLLTNPFESNSADESQSLSQRQCHSIVISTNEDPNCASLKRKSDILANDSSDRESEASFHCISKPKKRNRAVKLVLSDDEENENVLSPVVIEDKNATDKQATENESDSDDDDRVLETVSDEENCDEIPEEYDDFAEDDEEMKLAREITKHKLLDGKTKTIRREFVENEAELSGSDMGSDDEDTGSENDELEVEEGDLDDLPSDDELRAQVGKIHNKQMLDDDRRKLLMYKDAYLPDGDMQSDTDILRRFRWRKPEDENLNLHENGENVEEIIEDESLDSWRQLLKENVDFFCGKGLDTTEVEGQSLDNDASTSELFGFKKIAVRRSISSVPAISFSGQGEQEYQNESLFITQTFVKSRRESFLNRQQSTLHRIVNENSNSNLASATAASSTKCLFLAEQSLSSAVDISQHSRSESVRSGTAVRLRNQTTKKVQANKNSNCTVVVKTENVNSVFELLK